VLEIEAIAELSGVPFEDVFIINFTYELFIGQSYVGCTAAVVSNSRGELLLGRNLDYSLMQEYSDLAIQFDHYDRADAKLLYSTS
jgi:hypothetical protein